MEEKIDNFIHQSVHNFMQEVAVGLQNIPEEYEKNKKYLFVFLDHLGFSNKVLKATENNEWLSFCTDMGILIDENLKNTLNKCQQWNSPVSLVREKHFSDSICLFWEIGDYDKKDYYSQSELAVLLRDIFFLIANIQMNASIHEAIFRGGVAVGHYFEYNDITVSDALVRAHNIENSIKIPAVGIDESVWTEIGDENIHRWYFDEGYLKKHMEKQSFEYIDFINVILKNETVLKLKMEGMYFMNFKNAVLSNWSAAKATMKNEKMNFSLKKKYEWLFEYYNTKCAEKDQLKYAMEKEYIEDLKSLDEY